MAASASTPPPLDPDPMTHVAPKPNKTRNCIIPPRLSALWQAKNINSAPLRPRLCFDSKTPCHRPSCIQPVATPMSGKRTTKTRDMTVKMKSPMIVQPTIASSDIRQASRLTPIVVINSATDFMTLSPEWLDHATDRTTKLKKAEAATMSGVRPTRSTGGMKQLAYNTNIQNVSPSLCCRCGKPRVDVSLVEPTKLPTDSTIIASSVALIAHVARLFAVRGTIISAGCCGAALETAGAALRTPRHE